MPLRNIIGGNDFVMFINPYLKTVILSYILIDLLPKIIIVFVI